MSFWFFCADAKGGVSSAQQPEAQAEIRWLTATSARLFPTIDLLPG